MPIKDVNHIPAFKKKLKKLNKKRIEVGILGDGKLAMIGASNEFGARIPVSEKFRKYMAAVGYPIRKSKSFFIIPERSWLRSTFDDKNVVKKVYKMAEQVFLLEENLDKVLDGIGIFMTSSLQKKMRSNIQPANSAFTVERKGGKNKTLIDSGRLLQGITHNVK